MDIRQRVAPWRAFEEMASIFATITSHVPFSVPVDPRKLFKASNDFPLKYCDGSAFATQDSKFMGVSETA